MPRWVIEDYRRIQYVAKAVPTLWIYLVRYDRIWLQKAVDIRRNRLLASEKLAGKMMILKFYFSSVIVTLGISPTKLSKSLTKPEISEARVGSTQSLL